MICPNCGQTTVAGSVFCDNCGIRLNMPDIDPQSRLDAVMDDQFNSFGQTISTESEFSADFDPRTADTVLNQQYQSQASASPVFTQQFQPQPQPQAETFEPSNMGEVAAPVFSPATGGDAAGKDGESTSFFSTEQLYLPVSIGNWIGTFVLLFLIPLAFGVIACFIGDYFLSDTIWSTVIALAPMVAYIAMLFIYAFNSKVNPSKRNYFRAILILSLILIIIVGILVVVFSSFLASYVGNLENSEQLQHWINSIPV
ncbi:MAG: zinc ribbon domain-containing protein [Clostridiales bacterium]